MGLRYRIKQWWHGTLYNNEERGHGLIFVNHYDRHWTSRAVRAAWDYFKAHHQWIIGLIIAIVLALVVKVH